MLTPTVAIRSGHHDALAMTIGRGSFGPLNMALLLAAVFGVGLFGPAESRAASPLIRLAMFHNPGFSASLAMSTLVSTVMMATLAGVPAGRIVDRLGAQRVTIAGLSGIAAGSFVLSMMPARFGIAGYIAPIVVVTAGYALFQAANNTAIMTDIRPDQRGVLPVCSANRVILGSLPVHPLWALCSRSHRRRPTSGRRPPRPLPPACGSRSERR